MDNLYVQYMYSYPHKTAYGPLKGVDLRDYEEKFAGTGHGLYFHVPFCQSKCGYCNLFSVTGLDSEVMERYLDSTDQQLCQYTGILRQAGAVFSDFTIGGGTPLLLEERLLQKVFDMADRYLTFTPDRQIVIETAPNQTTKEKLELLKRQRVTRVSMGIQSFLEQELKVLGRNHSKERARKALDLVKSFDFPCVNVDFIYGIPGQTVDSLLWSLKEALKFQPDELFLYPLYVKHGAGLLKNMREGMVLNPKGAYEEYREAAFYLKSEGYRQDSMRRFVRQKYDGPAMGNREFSDCGFHTSLALGCGGRSYVGNLHFCTPYAITREGCLAEFKAFLGCEDYRRIRHGIILSEEEEKRRYVIRHILIQPGLDKERYRQRFGRCVSADFPVLVRWLNQGYLKEEGTFFTLTEEGMGLSDYLGPQLISPEIARRMEEWEYAHREDGSSL